MGMYTNFWGKIQLKPEYVEVFHKELFEDNYEGDEYWDMWKRILPDGHPYAGSSRDTFIPRGYWHGSGDDQVLELVGDTLGFQCSLKDYDDTIELFIETVLPEIALTYYLYSQYEEDEHIDYYSREAPDAPKELEKLHEE